MMISIMSPIVMHLARMTSADPTVTDPFNPQGWNRYSYVGNDPLAFTDPNGFSWLSSFFHSVTHFFATNSIARAILQIGLNIVLTAVGLPLVAAAFVSSAVTTGLSGGNLGQSLRAGAIAAATVFALSGVNTFAPAQAFGANFNPVAYAENVAGSALVGCASSAASGGSCGSGAAAGALSAGLAPLTNSLFQNARYDVGERIGGTIIQATAGGLASVAGGGKFENGAVTGAFQYLVALGPVSRDPRMEANAQTGPGSGLTGSGLIRLQVDPSYPYAATSDFLSRFEGTPEQEQVTQTIKSAASGAPARELRSGVELGLPGGDRSVYYVYSLGPESDPGAGRIANVPGSLSYYYSPGHYRPTPSVPNTWVQFVYPVMGSNGR
jgi:hypothetical protein